MASSSASAPCTFRMDSNWPANDLSGASSAVALERTAKLPPSPNPRQAANTASLTVGGTTDDAKLDFASRLNSASWSTRAPARSDSNAESRARPGNEARNCSKAAVVTQKLRGTASRPGTTQQDSPLCPPPLRAGSRPPHPSPAPRELSSPAPRVPLPFARRCLKPSYG